MAAAVQANKRPPQAVR